MDVRKVLRECPVTPKDIPKAAAIISLIVGSCQIVHIELFIDEMG